MPMSFPMDVSLKDELLFIESLLIPSFDPDNELDTSQKRKKWQKTRGEQKRWGLDVLTELIERFGTVTSLEEAESELERKLQGARKRRLETDEGLERPSTVFEVTECAICMSSVPETIFLPCAHLCTCLGCYMDMRERARPICPLCRRAIKSVMLN